MATILRGYNAGDGYDIEVTLVTGEAHVFHFASGQPKDAQRAVNEAEIALLAVVAAEPALTAKQQATEAASTLLNAWPSLSKADQDAIKVALQPITAAAVIQVG